MTRFYCKFTAWVLASIVMTNAVTAQQTIVERIPFDARVTLDCQLLEDARLSHREVSDQLGVASARLTQCTQNNCSDGVQRNLEKELRNLEGDLLLRQATLELLSARHVRYDTRLNPSQSSILGLFFSESLEFVSRDTFEGLQSGILTSARSDMVPEGKMTIRPAPGEGKLHLYPDYGYIRATLSGNTSDICDHVERNDNVVFSLTKSFVPPGFGPLRVKTTFSFVLGGRSEKHNVELTLWIRPIVESFFSASPHRLEAVTRYFKWCDNSSTAAGRVTEISPELGKYVEERDGSSDPAYVFIEPQQDQLRGLGRFNERFRPKPNPVTYAGIRAIPEHLFNAIGLLRFNIAEKVGEGTWPTTGELLADADIELRPASDGKGILVHIFVSGVDVGALRLIPSFEGEGASPFLIDKVEDAKGLIYTCEPIKLPKTEYTFTLPKFDFTITPVVPPIIWDPAFKD